MEEYIERNAAVEALTLHDCDSAGAKIAILDLPAAEVAPVVHGRWLPPVVGKYGCLCSVCKKQSDNGYDYCPNCGAKMDLN